jgi:hypothetical protein
MFESYKSIPNFWATFSRVKVVHDFFCKNGLGYILGDFILKLIWSPCSQHLIALHSRGCSHARSAGLPEDIFSYQNENFWYNLGSLGMRMFGLFRGHY